MTEEELFLEKSLIKGIDFFNRKRDKKVNEFYKEYEKENKNIDVITKLIDEIYTLNRIINDKMIMLKSLKQ